MLEASKHDFIDLCIRSVGLRERNVILKRPEPDFLKGENPSSFFFLLQTLYRFPPPNCCWQTNQQCICPREKFWLGAVCGRVGEITFPCECLATQQERETQSIIICFRLCKHLNCERVLLEREVCWVFSDLDHPLIPCVKSGAKWL